jgi:hypothetical protein
MNPNVVFKEDVFIERLVLGNEYKLSFDGKDIRFACTHINWINKNDGYKKKQYGKIQFNPM